MYIPDFIIFLENIDKISTLPLLFDENSTKTYPVGILKMPDSNEVRIHFMHDSYKQNILSKWNRRVCRMVEDKSLQKYLFLNDCDFSEINDNLDFYIKKFFNITYGVKIFFCKKRTYDNLYNHKEITEKQGIIVIIPEFCKGGLEIYNYVNNNSSIKEYIFSNKTGILYTINKSKCYVINLKRRPDRFELFKKNCPLDISKVNKFEAVDGKSLNYSNIPNSFVHLRPGEIGCFLSHKLLWEKTLKEKDSDYSIIFEDDAKFTENFLEEFNDIINTSMDFDILFIGGRFTKNYKMINCIKVKDKIVKYDYNKNWVAMDCDRTTHAYIISKKCCEIFLEDFNKIIEKHLKFPPINHYMMRVLRLNKKDIYHTYPLLCHSEMISDSDIRS